MRNNRLIIVASVLAFLLLAWLFFLNSNKKHDWNENYNIKNSEPYGLKILYNLLKNYEGVSSLNLNDSKYIHDYLRSKKISAPSTYITIGQTTFYTDKEIDTLVAFMKNGNTVFISNTSFDLELIKKINRKCKQNIKLDIYATRNFVYSNFTNPSLKGIPRYRLFFEFKGEKVKRYWQVFKDDFCDNQLDFEILATLGNKERPNFIKIKVGDGQLLMHSNPIVFTNRYLITQEGKEYVEKVFSYFPNGPIVWDKYATLLKFSPNMPGNEKSNPLGYILSQKSFKWAYYSIWILVFIFVLFNLWRKQRPIEPKFPNINTSLEFIKTIGELFYKNKDHRKLAIMKMEFFIKNMRKKYFIRATENDKFAEELAKKIGVSKHRIDEIFDQYKNITNASTILKEDELTKFYRNIDHIYKRIQ